MTKCSCYQEQLYRKWIGPDEFDDVIRPECWGTPERDECTCGGDKSKCDFYPEKKDEPIKREIVHKPTVSEFRRMAIQLEYEKIIYAHWIERPLEKHPDTMMDWCSNCNHRALGKYKRCPECGAHMIEE